MDDDTIEATGDLFTQVRTKRGYESIAQQIRDAIAAGKLNVGDRLPAERDMAELFGVSRQSVREAIRALESAGLIEIKLGVRGGALVRGGDPSTVTRAMTDSSPVRVTWAWSTPWPLIVPARTGSSTRRGTGRGSPVSDDWSTSLSPKVTVASAGILSPGRTRMVSPGARSASGSR
jgi:DNA-binding transcriptional MocR family regulator